MHHPAVVPDEKVTESPFVPVDDLWTCRMSGQLLDQRTTLGFGHADDMVHSHSEDERLASRSVAPDQRMLTHAPSPRPLAPGFRFAPGRQFLWGGRWVRGTIRGLEAVDHAQGLVVLALRIGKIVVCRVRVAELGIPSLRRKTARGKHGRLRWRPVVEE